MAFLLVGALKKSDWQEPIKTGFLKGLEGGGDR